MYLLGRRSGKVRGNGTSGTVANGLQYRRNKPSLLGTKDVPKGNNCQCITTQAFSSAFGNKFSAEHTVSGSECEQPPAILLQQIGRVRARLAPLVRIQFPKTLHLFFEAFVLSN